MIKIDSQEKVVPYDAALVYGVLSNLENLERVSHLIPKDEVKDFTYDQNSVSFSVSPIGNVSFAIVERRDNELIRFKSDKLPFDVYMDINLSPETDSSTFLGVSVEANIGLLMKGMVEKPLTDVAERVSEVLSNLKYDQI
ncbi:MAG: SRPBCC family protein [Fermentimonas sp.]|jgi:carbon monoxide dehydrogenase subunit G